MQTSLGRLLFDRLNAQLTGVNVTAKRRAQEGSLPAAVYEIQLGAGVEGTANVRPALVLVTCEATTSLGAEAAAAAVQTALQGWSGSGYDVALIELDLTNAQQEQDDESKVWFSALSFSAMAIL